MRRALLAAGLLAAAGSMIALAVAIPLRVPGAAPRARHQLADLRHRGPGIHRMSPAELAVRDRVAADESHKIELARAARAHAFLPSVPATTWVNLGPTDAPKEFNFYQIQGVDSGRPNSIVVDPRDPNVVYMAVSGGGVWKSFDFLADGGGHWAPTMDTQPNLAVGALALDDTHPDTLYAGNGDFVDTSGNTILKSTDGGGTWQKPVVLDGAYGSGYQAHPQSIRQITAHGATVFAATDVGLFESTDGGASFALVDLPNADGAILVDAIWNIVPLGGGAYLASGQSACDPGGPPPNVFYGFDPSPSCTYGNNVSMWRTADGVTWSRVTLPFTGGTGRTSIAAGVSADPSKTVVYAYVGANFGQSTLAFWRSTDGGVTWKDASGTVANPTLPYAYPDGNGGVAYDHECESIDVGNGQTWYNQAIVVDPTNPDHVLVGGNLCGMRTLNGTADAPTWEMVSHWLPSPDSADPFGYTANGPLPYVHADWHTATSVATPGGGVRTFAGTDGGIFASTNVFDDKTPAEQVVWEHHNRGLSTHLMYALASGDPADGNGFVLFAGLQDNGTRFRADPKDPSAFNQAIGGDGIGATVHTSSSGTTYWGSSQHNRAYCFPAQVDCAVDVPSAMEPDVHWHGLVSPVPADEGDGDRDEHAAPGPAREVGGGDEEPFLIRYANVETDTTGQTVLTNSDYQVFAILPDGNGGFAMNPISQDTRSAGGISNVVASRAIPDLFGAVGANGGGPPFYVTTHGTAQVAWTAANPVRPSASGALTAPSSMDFPPVTPAGKQPGDVFIGAFTGILDDGTVPPVNKGRIYRTTDGGKTWTSITGDDPRHYLPNVPVYVVKYDPVTPTTIYAGTELGVYITLDDGATWDRMGDNFPVVPVRDLFVAKNQDFIRAATYGRGLWEIYPSAQANHGAPGNGDYDRNLRIDWVDLGAMSARLGVSPEATTAPLYSWILDMTPGAGDPPVDGIDDDDLKALLAKFGGHP